MVDRQVTPAAEPPAEVPEDAVEWNLANAKIGRIRAANAWWQIEEVGESNEPQVPFVINGAQAKGYWVVRVPKEIIDGHSGIFDDGAIDFIAGLYRVCRREIREGRKVMLAPVLGDEEAPVASPTRTEERARR